MADQIPSQIKYVYLYNKIISYYIIFLAVVMIIGSAILGVGGAGIIILVPLGIAYLFWYFFMMWGLKFKKKYSYWINIIIHIIIALVNIKSLFNPTTDKILGIEASFISMSGIGVIVINIIWSLLFISASGYVIYTLFKKNVKNLF